MQSSVSRLLFLSLIGIMTAAAGCNDGPGGAPHRTLSDHDDHDHDHDHASGEGHDGHAHPVEGPHHGLLVELGNEEYHAEVVHDDVNESLTIYLLDSAAANPVESDATEVTINIKQGETPMQFKLPGKASDSSSEGRYSEYSLTSKELLQALHNKTSTARLSLTINGQPYSGEIKHDTHAEHDHSAHDHKH